MSSTQGKYFPLVSAVIPTHNRPQLVCRAVRSALDQTYSNLEVIVVVDGPEPETVQMLEALHEPRLKVVALTENAGLAEARNIGVRHAKGQWIGFLDDDDEWLPDKIDKQLSVLAHADPLANFIGCRHDAVYDDCRSIKPYRFPRPDENWSEYIYCDAHDLLPSTFLVKTELMIAMPFTKGIPSNEDSDWLLRVRAAHAIVPEWNQDALIVYHCESSLDRTSTRHNWELQYRWAVEQRQALLTRKAFSYCLLRLCLPHVKHRKKPLRNTLFLLHKAITMGRIDLYFCIYFVTYSLLGGWGLGLMPKFQAGCLFFLKKPVRGIQGGFRGQ
jgi:glycosyltransferase involved in cell wall biosynthesis